MKKKDLISIVQQVEPFQNPKIDLEQYTIDAKCAVDIAYVAGFRYNDIKNKVVFDLGTGTGRLSVASAYLQANQVISIDSDFNALLTFKRSVDNLNLNHIINIICSDIQHLSINSKKFENLKITTIMNPPFGVQRKSADRPFLEKALLFSDIVYSIHLANSDVTNFIEKFIDQYENWVIDLILPFQMILDRSFSFHQKERKMIHVNVFRIIKKI